MDPASQGPRGSKARVLVIDDDAQLRSTVRRALERAGYDVLEASDGAEGIQKSREHAPHVVVLDIYMPGRDGLEFLRDLRREDQRTRVIAISGGGEIARLDMLGAALAFGAARALPKPVVLGDLVAAVGEVLEDEPR